MTLAVIFAELAQVPWPHAWWSGVLGLMNRLANISESSLHRDILTDNIVNALGPHNLTTGLLVFKSNMPAWAWLHHKTTKVVCRA